VPSPRGRYPRVSGPTRSRAPFQDPPPRRSAHTTDCFELERPPTACLAARCGARPTMRTTDFCFPLLRLRAPAPRQLPASLRDLRLALGARACTRDQETGGPGVSRRPIRFGGPARVGNDGVNSSVCARSNRTSDTPVAPAPPRRTFVRRLGPGRRGRARRSSVKIERAPRPRVPSIDEGHSRACANRCRSRKRSRDASASIRPSAPFRPQLLAPRFWRKREVTAS